jgi:chemotaxis protein methyltransferase CheR
MEFNDFHKWIHKELGINLLAYKPEQLNRRINSLMGRIGVKTLEEYTVLIKKDEDQKQKFLDFITINVTEFFRNPELYDELKEIMNKELLSKSSQLKIWSAACSIGCEPYTLGIILSKLSKNKKHNIIATDIDNTILNRAKTGEFGITEMKNISADDLAEYFTQKDGKYYINSTIKSMVTFKKHDLILESFEKDYDLILCRNVVIYFNNDIKNQIYKKFSESLKKGGLLFVGATESIYNYKEYGFEKASTFIYRKL